MSRLLIIAALLVGNAAFNNNARAQSLTDAQLAAIIKKQRQTISIDSNGCLRDPNDDGDTIIVCGESDDNKSQKLTAGTVDNDRIRRGEAISTTKAASCIGAYPACAHRLKKVIGIGFGKVPPPAIPLEEIYRGLPEPEDVVVNE